MPSIALGSGEWILVLVVVLMIVGVAIGLFSRGGSGIATHPRPGDRGDSVPDDDGELPGTEGRRFPGTRGTR